MGKRRKKDAEKLPVGPLGRRRGYSVALQDEILARRPEIRLYLKEMEQGFVRDLAPEGEAHLTTARRCHISRLMGKLAAARVMEAYMADYGLIDPASIEKGAIRAAPIVETWLALGNQIRRDLEAIGWDRRAIDVTMSPLEILEEDARAARDGQGDGYVDAGAENSASRARDAEKSPQDARYGPSDAKSSSPPRGDKENDDDDA